MANEKWFGRNDMRQSIKKKGRGKAPSAVSVKEGHALRLLGEWFGCKVVFLERVEDDENRPN